VKRLYKTSAGWVTAETTFTLDAPNPLPIWLTFFDSEGWAVGRAELPEERIDAESEHLAEALFRRLMDDGLADAEARELASQIWRDLRAKP
jgi:hypothetical protein